MTQFNGSGPAALFAAIIMVSSMPVNGAPLPRAKGETRVAYIAGDEVD